MAFFGYGPIDIANPVQIPWKDNVKTLSLTPASSRSLVPVWIQWKQSIRLFWTIKQQYVNPKFQGSSLLPLMSDRFPTSLKKPPHSRSWLNVRLILARSSIFRKISQGIIQECSVPTRSLPTFHAVYTVCSIAFQHLGGRSGLRPQAPVFLWICTASFFMNIWFSCHRCHQQPHILFRCLPDDRSTGDRSSYSQFCFGSNNLNIWGWFIIGHYSY